VLKGTVGFGNPEQLGRQRARIERTVTVGSADEVAARLHADRAAGVELHCLRLVYDFTAADALHAQLDQIAAELPPLLVDGGTT